jgi:putative transposase
MPSKKKFKNKYRIESIRKPSWDYGSNAAYFITICTNNREHFFGEIVDGQMNLNQIGQFAHNFWLEIPEHYPFVLLNNFVIMPNHMHGILIINKPDGFMGNFDNVATPNFDNVAMPNFDIVATPNLGVATISKLPPKRGGKNEKWKPNSVGSIINQYKRIVTINARKINADFAWQSRYYDSIIKNGLSFEIIKNYIAKNPAKWTEG